MVVIVGSTFTLMLNWRWQVGWNHDDVLDSTRSVFRIFLHTLKKRGVWKTRIIYQFIELRGRAFIFLGSSGTKMLKTSNP